jgi:hypothetical protein
MLILWIFTAYYVEEFPTFQNAYQKMNPPENITDELLGSRLIPRSVVQQNLTEVVSAFRAIVEKDTGLLISGVMVNSSRVAYPDNGVNPAWRDALMSVVIGASVYSMYFSLWLWMLTNNLDLGLSIIRTGIEMLRGSRLLLMSSCRRWRGLLLVVVLI